MNENILTTQRTLISRKQTNQFLQLTNKPSCWDKSSTFAENILHSKTFTICFTVAIVLNLFLDELKEIFFPKEYDSMIEIVLVFLFSFFVAEVLFSFIFIRGYRFSFFFYADIFAIAGLVPTVQIFFHSDSNLEYTPQSSPNYLGIFLGNSHVTKTVRVTISGSKYGIYN
jgi:hypothetical protein